jgi:hypothetical protein
LVIVKGGKLRSLVHVDQVIEATDAGSDPKFVGKSVRLVQGKIVKRLGDVSVEAASRRAQKNGVAPPRIINAALTGFKQGAFCCQLTTEQGAELSDWP